MPSYLTPGVYVEEVASSSATLSAGATAVAAFVGFTAKAPTDDPADPEGLKPRLVTNWTQFEGLYGGFTAGAMLPHSVYGFFNNGGSDGLHRAHPEHHAGHRVGPARADRPATAPSAPPSSSPRSSPTPTSTVTVTPGADGRRCRRRRAADVQPHDHRGGTRSPRVFSGVTLGGIAIEPINGTSTKVKVETLIDVDQLAADLQTLPDRHRSRSSRPRRRPVPVPGRAFAGSEIGPHGHQRPRHRRRRHDGHGPRPRHRRHARTTAPIDLNLWKSVQLALINHCEGQANRMAILDAPPGMTPQQIKEWRSDVAMYDSPFAALYYPWIKVANPVGTNGDTEIMVPPSATWPASGPAPTTPAACGRPRPTRSCAARSTSR